MPMHPDFIKLRRGMIKQYGEEKGARVFYAFVNKHKLDPDKPMPSKLPNWAETTTEILDIFSGQSKLLETEERFDWLDETFETAGENLIKGHAIHADIPTGNKVTYTSEELIQAARTLKGKNLFLNHLEDANLVQEYVAQKAAVLDPDVRRVIERLGVQNDTSVGQVVEAEYVDSDVRAIEYVAKVTDSDAWNLIRQGKVIGVSVGATPRRTIESNGKLPVGVFFDDLSLITAPERAGDPEATVRLWEKLREMVQETHLGPHDFDVDAYFRRKKPVKADTAVTVNASETSGATATAGIGHTAIQVGPTPKETRSSVGGSNMGLTKEDLEAIQKVFQDGRKLKHQNNGEEEGEIDYAKALGQVQEDMKAMRMQLDELAGKFKSFEAQAHAGGAQTPSSVGKAEGPQARGTEPAEGAKGTPSKPQYGTASGGPSGVYGKSTETVHREGIIGVPGQEPDLTGQNTSEERPQLSFSGVMSRLTGRKQ